MWTLRRTRSCSSVAWAACFSYLNRRANPAAGHPSAQRFPTALSQICDTTLRMMCSSQLYSDGVHGYCQDFSKAPRHDNEFAGSRPRMHGRRHAHNGDGYMYGQYATNRRSTTEIGSYGYYNDGG